MNAMTGDAMGNHKADMAQDAAETAEMAFRRIACRKLIERGYSGDQIEAKLSELLRKGTNLRTDLDENVMHCVLA